jgi:hypothetical protein
LLATWIALCLEFPDEDRCSAVVHGPNIDEDRGDVHQAFLEIGPHASRPHGMSLRAGRQEIVLGSGSLFDNNEGPNVKLSFDGFRAIAEGAHARLDLFAVKPVENNLGWFDDVPNHRQTALGKLSDCSGSHREPRPGRFLLHRAEHEVSHLQQGHCPGASPHRGNQTISPHREGFGLQLGSQLPMGEI